MPQLFATVVVLTVVRFLQLFLRNFTLNSHGTFTDLGPANC